jgi:hypothetical protein
LLPPDVVLVAGLLLFETGLLLLFFEIFFDISVQREEPLGESWFESRFMAARRKSNPTDPLDDPVDPLDDPVDPLDDPLDPVDPFSSFVGSTNSSNMSVP